MTTSLLPRFSPDIEHSRVLKGKPVPVELKPVSVRAVVEAGANFQKPRFSQGHTLSVEGEDFLIHADEMKMVDSADEPDQRRAQVLRGRSAGHLFKLLDGRQTAFQFGGQRFEYSKLRNTQHKGHCRRCQALHLFSPGHLFHGLQD